MKGLPRSIGKAADNAVAISKLHISAASISVTDGNPGYGNVAISGLPEGNILILGATSYIRFTTTSSNVTSTFDGDYAIGTAGTSDGNVSDSGEANVISSTALGAATAKVSPSARGEKATSIIIDNTANDKKLYLNLLIDDASISGNATFTASGNVFIAYAILGDD